MGFFDGLVGAVKDVGSSFISGVSSEAGNAGGALVRGLTDSVAPAQPVPVWSTVAAERQVYREVDRGSSGTIDLLLSRLDGGAGQGRGSGGFGLGQGVGIGLLVIGAGLLFLAFRR